MVTDQARSQDGSILAKFFFCIFMDQHEVEVHVDRTSLANKGFINLRELFLAGLTWEMPSGQDYFSADKMIKKISQQNKIDWFASFYSLDFDLKDSFKLISGLKNTETFEKRTDPKVRSRRKYSLHPSRESGMSVHRRFTYEWYTIKRKRGAKLSV